MHSEQAIESYQDTLGQPLDGFAQAMQTHDLPAQNAADKFASDLTEILHNAGVACFGKQKMHPRRAQWWTDEYATLRQECCSLFERSRRTRSSVDVAAYESRRRDKNVMKRALKRAFTRAQANHVAVACSKGLNDKSSWKAAKRLRGLLTRGCAVNRAPTPTVVVDGSPTDDVEAVMQVFSGHYHAEMNPVPNAPFCAATDLTVSNALIDWQNNPPHYHEKMDSEFHICELNRALDLMHFWKAEDHDGLICELLRQGGQALRSAILALLNHCWTTETIPESWTKGTIVSLYKNGAAEDPSNYRGITLLSVFRKLFSTMLKIRLEAHVSLHESQAAFRPDRGCTDHVYTFARIVRAATKHRTPLYAFFLDIRKAYDTVWREGLMYKLLKKGVTGRLGRVISRLLSGTQARVRFGDRESSYFPISLGVGQGDPLSTILFDIFIDDLLEELHSRPDEHGIPVNGESVTCISNLTYADDVNALSLSPEGLQGHIDTIDAWLYKWRSSPNVSKSKTMVFCPPPHAPPFVFRMRGCELECVSTYKYLGVFFQSDGSWTKHVQHVRAKMHRALGMWRPLLSCHLLPVSVRLRLVSAFVYTPALYGAEAWIAAQPDLDKFDTTCMNAIRTVFGLHQLDCHAEILFADTGLLPISSLVCAAMLCWKSKLSRMSVDRFPCAVDSILLPGPATLGRPPGGDFHACLKKISKDIQQYTGTCLSDERTRRPAGRTRNDTRRFRSRGAANTQPANLREYISYSDLKRETILPLLWTSYLAKALERREEKCREGADWMRSVIRHELGSPAPFMFGVGSGLVRVLLCARSRKLSLLGVPRVSKHLCLPLPAGAFTDYISRAPVGTVLPPVPEAQRPWQAPALLAVAESLLSSASVYGGDCGVSWSDVAVVFIAGVGTSDCSAVGVSARPLPLAELARVIAFCCVHPVLKQFVSWLPRSVPVPGVVNVLMDSAM